MFITIIFGVPRNPYIFAYIFLPATKDGKPEVGLVQLGQIIVVVSQNLAKTSMSSPREIHHHFKIMSNNFGMSMFLMLNETHTHTKKKHVLEDDTKIPKSNMRPHFEIHLEDPSALTP